MPQPQPSLPLPPPAAQSVATDAAASATLTGRAPQRCPCSDSTAGRRVLAATRAGRCRSLLRCLLVAAGSERGRAAGPPRSDRALVAAVVGCRWPATAAPRCVVCVAGRREECGVDDRRGVDAVRAAQPTARAPHAITAPRRRSPTVREPRADDARLVIVWVCGRSSLHLQWVVVRAEGEQKELRGQSWAR